MSIFGLFLIVVFAVLVTWAGVKISKVWSLKEEFTKFNLEDYLTTDELRKEYLNQVLADGDIEEFKRALFYIAKSKGIENVAKKANLNRESFYKMFKENSKPRFESIFKVVNALDIKLVYA